MLRELKPGTGFRAQIQKPIPKRIRLLPEWISSPLCLMPPVLGDTQLLWFSRPYGAQSPCSGTMAYSLIGCGLWPHGRYDIMRESERQVNIFSL